MTIYVSWELLLCICMKMGELNKKLRKRPHSSSKKLEELTQQVFRVFLSMIFQLWKIWFNWAPSCVTTIIFMKQWLENLPEEIFDYSDTTVTIVMWPLSMLFLELIVAHCEINFFEEETT